MQKGRARLTSVEVGHTDGRFSQIISGLAVGDKVLLHPPDTVTDGSAVKASSR
jgi:HlyD family secretion protein